MSWETVSIGDICDVKGGKRLPKGHDYSPEPTPYRYIRVADINDSKIDAASLNYLYPETHKKISKYIVNTGDVIISIAGTIGVTVPVINELDGINLTENAAKLVPKEKDIYDPYYLSLVFQSPFVQHQISGLTGQVTIGKLALFRIKEIEIPLPELGEQRRIAAVLDKADALRQKRRAALAKLDTLLQATFLHMFGDPVTNPMGWEVVTLGKLASHVGSGSTPRGGSSVYSDEGYLFIRSQNVLMFSFDFSDIAYIDQEIFDNMQRSVVKKNDVLLNITGASIGRVNFFEGEDNSANVNQHVCIIRPKMTKILPEYLTYHLGVSSFQNKILGQNAGATRQAFNFKQIKSFQLMLPSLKKQMEFADSVKKINQTRSKYESSIVKADNLFHALQQRAFSGQL